jgi:hypothetical protein
MSHHMSNFAHASDDECLSVACFAFECAEIVCDRRHTPPCAQELESTYGAARLDRGGANLLGSITPRRSCSWEPMLYEAKRSGQIKSFILPYLGQLDRELPNPPVDLVRREQAHAYPTDFNAMTPEWIDRLSLRGEQLTKCCQQT